MANVKTSVFDYNGRDAYVEVVGDMYNYDLLLVVDDEEPVSILLPMHDSFYSKANASLVILNKDYVTDNMLYALKSASILRLPKIKPESIICSNPLAIDYYIDKSICNATSDLALMLRNDVFNRKHNRVMTSFFNVERGSKGFSYPELYLNKLSKDTFDSKGSVVWAVGGSMHGREQSQFWVKVYYNDKEYSDDIVRDWFRVIANSAGVIPVSKGEGVK